MLNYRATPITVTGVSPAQLLMDRSIRTTLPVLQQNMDPKWLDLDQMRQQDQKSKESYSYHYNKRQGQDHCQNYTTVTELLQS